jgi:hypothetical protein
MAPTPSQFTVKRMLGAMVFFAVAAAIFAQASREERYADGIVIVFLGVPVVGAGIGFLFGRPVVGFAAGCVLAFTSFLMLMLRSFD